MTFLLMVSATFLTVTKLPWLGLVLFLWSAASMDRAGVLSRPVRRRRVPGRHARLAGG